ncbi:hypothetical protein AVEN_4510-1 [Araneus ventricosus]|uniref:Uncharacterized protein n=1 Tax=Araneus ventricosus TaxID=182803 RepID=A0A4Y2BKQ2_ARAVE|nr:hypothetical protein AVEN_4510-1 [Araneus ventricosus]
MTGQRQKYHDYYETDVVTLKRGQMKRTTPKPAPSSPNFHDTPSPGRLTRSVFNVHQAHSHDGSPVEWGLKFVNLRSERQATR